MREIKIDPNSSDPLASALAKLAGSAKPRGRQCFRPGKGFVQNPLMGLPRNMACPCHSGKKFKKCCLELTVPYIPADALTNYKATMDEALTGKRAW